MTHEDKGHYGAKHPGGVVVAKEITDAVKKRSRQGALTCPLAFKIAGELAVASRGSRKGDGSPRDQHREVPAWPFRLFPRAADHPAGGIRFGGAGGGDPQGHDRRASALRSRIPGCRRLQTGENQGILGLRETEDQDQRLPVRRLLTGKPKATPSTGSGWQAPRQENPPSSPFCKGGKRGICIFIHRFSALSGSFPPPVPWPLYPEPCLQRYGFIASWKYPAMMP